MIAYMCFFVCVPAMMCVCVCVNGGWSGLNMIYGIYLSVGGGVVLWFCGFVSE